MKFLPRVGLKLKSLRIVVTACDSFYRLSSPGLMTFVMHVLPLKIHWYKFEAWWSRAYYFVFYALHYVIYLNTVIYLYWTHFKKIKKSCVCFQYSKHDQTSSCLLHALHCVTYWNTVIYLYWTNFKKIQKRLCPVFAFNMQNTTKLFFCQISSF